MDKYESWRCVPGITVPVLILRAEHDNTFPAASTDALLARFPPGQVQTVMVPRASHESILDDPLYAESLSAFDIRHGWRDSTSHQCVQEFPSRRR